MKQLRHLLIKMASIKDRRINIFIVIGLIVVIAVNFIIISHIENTWSRADQRLRLQMNRSSDDFSSIFESQTSSTSVQKIKKLLEYFSIDSQSNLIKKTSAWRLALIAKPIPLVPIGVLLYCAWLYFHSRNSTVI